MLLRDALDNTLKDAEDVERHLHLELLAAIPRYGKDDATLATEAYQNLRTALLFSRRGEAGQVVLITGTAPGEGKTTTLLNVAKLLAVSGETVVVVDCDLRRANLHLRLNVPREPGFTDFFVKNVDLSGLVRTTRIPNLWAIPAGTLPPNPPALLARADLGTALAQLKRHYRWVLVDSPPVAAVTDALLLAQSADATVLVVQQNKVDRAMVKRALGALRKVTPNVIGAVLNAVDVKTKGYYGYAVLRLPEGPPGEERGRRAAGQAPPPAGHAPRGGGDRCVHRLGGRAWPVARCSCSSPPRRRQRAQEALALARLSLVERKVELSKKGATWQAAVEGGPLQIGEALRTGPDAVARLELPWMALTLGPGSTLRFPDAFLLSASLESGRALVEAQGRDALKVVTEEAEVRGQGRAVVRRQGRETLVTCLAGRFYVQGGESTVTLAAGRGTVVRSGRAPSAPEDVPAPPSAGPVAREGPRLRGPRGAPGAALEGRRRGLPARAAARGLGRRAPAARRHGLARADRGALGRCLPLARLGPQRARPRGPARPRTASSPSTRSSQHRAGEAECPSSSSGGTVGAPFLAVRDGAPPQHPVGRHYFGA